MNDQSSSAVKVPSEDFKPPAQGLLDEARELSREFGGIVRDHLDVFVKEVGQAAFNFALLIGSGIVIAVLATFAWSACMDAATIGLISVGVSPAMALVWVALGNLGGAALGYAVMRLARGKIALPATRRLLTPSAALTPKPE